jgi:hypothetical protein
MMTLLVSSKPPPPYPAVPIVHNPYGTTPPRLPDPAEIGNVLLMAVVGSYVLGHTNAGNSVRYYAHLENPTAEQQFVLDVLESERHSHEILDRLDDALGLTDTGMSVKRYMAAVIEGGGGCASSLK